MAELVVAVGVVVLTGSLVAATLFELLGIERVWRDRVVATREMRNAESWFAADAVNAQSTGLIDGAPPAPTVTLAWTDGLGIPHEAAYSLAGTRLVREYDGVQTTVARRVVSAGFSLSGKVVTLDLEVEAEPGTTENTNLNTYLRTMN